MIHVIVGPPCAGKTTLVQERRADGDIVVDFDLIAKALGASGHRPDGPLKEVAHVARRSVIEAVLAGVKADSWIVHTSPTVEQVHAYREAGATFELVDPGIDECLKRVGADGRPDGTTDTIRAWYESPPDLGPSIEPPKLGGFSIAQKEGQRVKVKIAPVQIKAGKDEGTFEAYASTFTREPDSYGDVVVPGAFEGTLKEWGDSDNVIPILWGHNMSDPDYNVGGVVEAHEDDHGLYVKGQLDLDDAKAAKVYRLIKGKRVNQMSFAYDVLDEGTVEEDGRKVNELRAVRLHEISIVPLGANSDTEIIAVKIAAERTFGEVKAGRVLAQKHIDSLRDAQAAIGAVIAAAEATEDQEKASGHTEVNDKEPSGVKSEEPRLNPSVEALVAKHRLLALNGGKQI